MANDTNSQAVVEISARDGVAFVEQASPLTRLHYFDGKFLRADALALEQDYHRSRTRLANIAGGWGVVSGLGLSLSGNQLGVGAGLAITAAGNFVLATGALQADIAALLEVAQPAPVGGNAAFADCQQAAQPGVAETAALAVYEVTVGPVEGLCGNEPVYGKLCETACVGDSRHPYWREGVVLRLRPVGLQLPTSSAVALSLTHLRNRVASAYFRAEPWLTPSAVSGAGLAGDVWCNPASLYGRDEVVIGLLVREAGVNRVLDAWGGRRERMDSQARGYWQGRMAMRPWNVFVAQILQFQCQLSGAFEPGDVITPPDDCDELRRTLDSVRKKLEALHKEYASSAKKLVEKFGESPTKANAQAIAGGVKTSYAELYELSNQLAGMELGQGALPANRLLLNAGFMELPPAGYLPVSPGKAPLAQQLERMFGEGVRLHYRAARADALPHYLEEAQHMERISLTRGLDDPQAIEDVEIFVPDGSITEAAAQPPGTWWQAGMSYSILFLLETLSVDPAKTAGTRDATAAPRGVLQKASLLRRLSGRAAQAGKAALKARALQDSHTIDEDTLLPGLARTHRSETGRTSFTAMSGLSTADGEIVTREDDGSVDVNFGFVGAYLAGDIDGDPFTLPVGGHLACVLDMRIGFHVLSYNNSDGPQVPDQPNSVYLVQGQGQVTLLRRQQTSRGTLIELMLDLIVSVRITSENDGEEQVIPLRSRLALLREGDAANGRVSIDDAAFDSRSPGLQASWAGEPLAATLDIVSTRPDPSDTVTSPSKAAAKTRSKAAAAKAMAPDLAAGVGPGLTAGVANGSIRALAVQRTTVISMAQLQAMPDAQSSVRARILNLLILMADVSEDPGLLVRARLRLFPDLGQDGSVPDIQAVRDWVLFRRERPVFCDPRCTAPGSDLGIEAFQLWHIRLADEARLKELQAMLANGDDLSGFEPRRVGVLRYRDTSTTPEEASDRVLGMWQLAQPASRVVLGRVWETAPVTGQGWQNHFRLREMLDQIASLTQPPPRGDSSLAAIPDAPVPLADGAVDGGMLVVTLAGAGRNALLLSGNWNEGNHFISKDEPQTPLQFSGNRPQGSALADYINTRLKGETVYGVTLATTRAAPDSGATARLKSVIQALVTPGATVPSERQVVTEINIHDRRTLLNIGIDPDQYDEVIFFELGAS